MLLFGDRHVPVDARILEGFIQVGQNGFVLTGSRINDDVYVLEPHEKGIDCVEKISP